MDRREAQAEIFFGHKKMAQVCTAIVPANIAITGFIDRAKVGCEFFISNMEHVIKISGFKNIPSA